MTEEHLEDEQFNMGFRSRIGFIFQNSDAQVFSPSVREEIAFGPLNMGMGLDEVQARVNDTLSMLDIDDLADRAPYQLSGGQKKRVAIASVLVMNPEVLLFDEPTAALDPRTQQWLLELIVELNRAGKTIVLATHDLDTLEVLADRCVVFSEDHRLVGEGIAGHADRWRIPSCCSRSTSSTSTATSTVTRCTATSTGSSTTDGSPKGCGAPACCGAWSSTSSGTPIPMPSDSRRTAPTPRSYRHADVDARLGLRTGSGPGR